MTRLEAFILHIAAILVFATGAAHFGMKYLMKGDDPFSAYHHPWQPHMLAAHVLAAPLLVFALGLILREHILARWLDRRRRPGRGTGIGAVLPVVPAIASGYVLQVVAAPWARTVTAWVHIVVGALFALLYVVHVVASRRAVTARPDVARARSTRRRRRLDPPRGGRYAIAPPAERETVQGRT